MSDQASYLYCRRKLPNGQWAIEIQRLVLSPPFERQFRRMATVTTKREAKAICNYRANHGKTDWDDAERPF